MLVKRIKEVLVWVAALLTIALFLMFQVRIQQDLTGMMRTLVESASFVIEILIVVGISALGS